MFNCSTCMKYIINKPYMLKEVTYTQIDIIDSPSSYCEQAKLS